ncbi:hypothetical protein OESDEN_23014, partial [Oesophagostomum dentatum]
MQWEQYFRGICCEYFRRNRPVLGGFAQVVEVDETCVTKRNRTAALPQGYTHLTVNYQVNFVDPGSGAHKNTECHWQKFKNMAKRKYGINNRRYRDYLSEFLWKDVFGKREESLYNFWKQVAELYPVQCWKPSMTQWPSLGPQ